MTTGIIIAAIAAVPGVLAAIYAYRVKHENPMENGADWVVNHYKTIATEALAERDAALVALEKLRQGRLGLPSPYDDAD